MDKNKTVSYIVKYDSILREEPTLSSKCLTVLLPKTKLEYLNESKEENDGEKYDKVKIIKNDNYQNESIGWILHKQIIEYKPSLSIETKNKLLETINFYLNTKTAYSMEIPERNGGFFNKPNEGKLYFDCSSFVTTVLNRNFNFPPPYPKGEDGEVVVWATIHYFENIKKPDSVFDIIQKIDKPGQRLDLNQLEVGDIILGHSKVLVGGINHILFYVGDGYIVHCTKGNFLGKTENEFRDGVVKEIISTNFYTEIETPENIEKNNITKRFDDLIYVIRFKEDNNKRD